MFQIKFKISIFLRDRRSLFNQWEEHREKKINPEISSEMVKNIKILWSCRFTPHKVRSFEGI